MSLDLSGLTYGASDQPKAPAVATPQSPSVGQEVEGAAKSTGNFFENLGKGLVQGVVSQAKSVKDVVESGFAGAKLTVDTSLQNAQTAKIAQEVKAASQLPTQAQRKAALANIGTPQKYVQQSDIDRITTEYNKLGIKNTDSELTMFKKAIPEGLNVGFAATAVAGTPLEAGVEGLKAIGSDAISGALVKAGLGSAADSASEGIAKTVGESLLEDGGKTAQVTVRAATEQGIKVLEEKSAKSILGKVVNAGVVNGTIAAVNQWSQGNNAATPQDKEDYLKSVGMGFLTGAAIEGTVTGVGVIKDVATANKLTSDLKDTYSGVIQKARVDELNQTADAKLKDLNDQNLEAGKVARAQQTLEKSTSAMRDLVGNTPVVQSYDDALQQMGEKYGVKATPVDPGSDTPSGVKRSDGGYSITFKKGDFADYMNQVGAAIPSILKDQGVSMSFFSKELDQIPDSGVKELDTPQAKVQSIVSGMNNADTVAEFRGKYPTVASAFDAIHGVVKKISPSDAAKSFVRDNLPEHYADIEQTIQKESSTLKPDPMTGSLKQTFDQSKYDKLWGGVVDLVNSGKAKGEVIKDIQTTVDKSDQVSQLRDAAASAGMKDPKMQATFEKADNASTSLKTLDDKIKFWNTHNEKFGIKSPDSTSRFDNPSPTFRESPLGSGTGSTSEGTPVEPGIQPEKELVPEKPQSIQESPEEGQKKSLTFQNVKEAVGDIGEGPTYDSAKRDVEIKKAVDLVSSDYDQAKRIANGFEDVPDTFNNKTSGLQFIRAAVVQKAAEEGDTITASSVLSQFSSTSTSLAKGLDATKAIYEDSVTGALKKALDFKRSVLSGKDEGEALDTKVDSQAGEIASEIKKNAMTDEDNQSFIDKITC